MPPKWALRVWGETVASLAVHFGHVGVRPGLIQLRLSCLILGCLFLAGVILESALAWLFAKAALMAMASGGCRCGPVASQPHCGAATHVGAPPGRLRRLAPWPLSAPDRSGPRGLPTRGSHWQTRPWHLVTTSPVPEPGELLTCTTHRPAEASPGRPVHCLLKNHHLTCYTCHYLGASQPEDS